MGGQKNHQKGSAADMFNGNNGYNKHHAQMGCHHQGKLKRQPYDTCSSEFLHAICGDDNADTDASANAIAIAIVNANVEADDERLTAAVVASSKGREGRERGDCRGGATSGNRQCELVNKSP